MSSLSHSFYGRTVGSLRHPRPLTVQGVRDCANPKSRSARRAQPVPRGMATAQASAAGHAATTPRLPATAPPARPHPAGPTHPCSVPRRSGRASGRCALRRDRLQVSGCERRRGSGRRVSTHRLQERWSPPALPWRRRRRWRRRRTRVEARRAAWSRSGPGGGSEVRLRPSRVSCARAPHRTARPALLARGTHIPGAGQLGGGTGSPEATDPRMQLRRKARPVGYSRLSSAFLRLGDAAIITGQTSYRRAHLEMLYFYAHLIVLKKG